MWRPRLRAIPPSQPFLHPPPCSHGELARCWRSWQQAVQLQRAKSARLQTALQHWAAGQAGAALRGWRQAAARSRLLHSKAGVVVSRWQRLCLAASWQSWREGHAQRVAKRYLLQGCMARLQAGAAGRAFRCAAKRAGRFTAICKIILRLTAGLLQPNPSCLFPGAGGMLWASAQRCALWPSAAFRGCSSWR